jgi:lycopene cyclase domain-containing protein
MPEYTALAVLSVAAAVVLARALRVRLFTRSQFWVAMAIVLAFQVLVDGWLTKLSAPIVRYDDPAILGWRFPWDIPVEDFLFGFSMVTSVIALWERAKRRPGGQPDAEQQEREEDARGRAG